MQPSPTPRPKYRRVLTVGAIIGAVWLTLCGVIAWWAPNATRQAAADWAQSKHYRLQIGKVSYNPFVWTARLDDIRLSDQVGMPLFSAKSLELEAKPLSLLLGRWRLAELSLDTPALTLSRAAGGTWNWARFVNDISGPPSPKQPAAKPPKIVLDHLAITRGRIQVNDGNEVAPPWRLDPVTLSLTDLTTLPVEGGYHLAASLDDGTHIEWQGNIRLEPLSSSGQLQVRGFTLARVWPLLAHYVKLDTPHGAIDMHARYKFGMAGKVSLDVPQFSASLHGLDLPAPGRTSKLSLDSLDITGGRFSLSKQRVAISSILLKGGTLTAQRNAAGEIDWMKAQEPSKPEPVQAPTTPSGSPWTIAVDKIALSNWQLAVRDESRASPLSVKARLPEAGFKFALGKNGTAMQGLYAMLADIRLSGEHGETPLTLAEAKLAPGDLSLDSHKFTPGKVSLSGLEVSINRDNKGKIDLLPLLSPRAPAPKTSRAKENTAREGGWKITPPAVSLAASNVRWHDSSTATPVNLTLSDLSAEGEAKDDDKLALKLSGHSGRGTLDTNWLITVPTGEIEGTVDARELPLVPLAPYGLAGTTLRMASGTASAQLKLMLPASAPWQIRGTASLDRFAIFEPQVRDPLVGWRQLRTDGLNVRGSSPLSMEIGQVHLNGAKLRLILDKQRNLNLTRLFSKGGQPSQPSQPSSNAPKPNFEIRSISVQNGEMDFADQSLSQNFSTRIHDLGGHIQGISSKPSRQGTVTLDGRVDTFGQAKVRGVLAPFAITDNTNILVTFRNIPMNSISPYSMTFAGWRIDDGRLNLDLRYQLKNRQIEGANNVVIQSIKLGDEVAQPGVKRLPLRLAVALLEDSDGRIELNLPVSGQLDDPKFSYGHLMWQAFVNVVEKVVTAPFRALANLFGSEGFDSVNFAPGQYGIDPPEQEKLNKLATIMSKRPNLTVILAGTYDKDKETRPLARANVDRDILTKAGLKPDPGLPLAIPDLDDSATRNAIKSVYADRIGRIKLMSRLLGTSDDRTRYQNLRNELIKAEQDKIDNKSLLVLARKRGEAARNEIVHAAPDLEQRVKLADPNTTHATEDGVPLSIKLETGALATAPKP